IGEADEAAILAARRETPPPPRAPAMLRQADPGPDYVARYAQAFGPSALSGRRIGVWAQAAVGRDLLAAVLSALGAELVEIDRREDFLALDTEAIDPDTRHFLRLSCAMHGVESIVSTDGDGDRPLVTDAEGRVIPGDLLGQITARYLGAGVVVTPMTSNSGVTQSGFDQVIRTRVGAPHVIAAMQAVLSERPGAAVVGYEANGGFLLGFAARGPAGPLPMLMTRDSLLPIVAALVMAGTGGLAALRDSLPDRATASDRLPRIDRRIARQVLTGLMQDAQARAAFLARVSERAQHCDLSDGLRMGLQSGRILHLRLSGNAPELRCYAEAESIEAASALLRAGLEAISRLLAQTD
ncbi:MAG: phosphomannomutase, partial [Alphaproteobacteria bacterium]|nr:phosphomannomutase [Alphaproteobacteria bacterium]